MKNTRYDQSSIVKRPVNMCCCPVKLTSFDKNIKELLSIWRDDILFALELEFVISFVLLCLFNWIRLEGWMRTIKKTIEHRTTCTASDFRQRLTLLIKSSMSVDNKKTTVGVDLFIIKTLQQFVVTFSKRQSCSNKDQSYKQRRMMFIEMLNKIKIFPQLSDISDVKKKKK